MTAVQNWRPEHRLLLLLARLALTEHETIEARRLLALDLDWPYLVGMAISHGVPQLAYRNLCQLGAERAVPADVVHLLEASCRANALRYGRLAAALRDIIRGLHEHGVEVIVLKGMALAVLVYPEPALRQCGDVDLLVREDDLSVATQTLTQLGYVSSPTLSDGPPHHQGFLKGHTLLELHWDILPRPHPFKLDVAELWARAQPVRIADAETWTLCPEDLLLHLCLHATFHRKFVQEHVGLRPFCDVTEMVRTPRLDWERVTRTASTWGVRKHLYVGLYVSRELLGAAVPDDVMAALRPRQLDPEMLADLVERVLLRHEVPAFIPPRFVRLLAAETPSGRLRVLREILTPPANAGEDEAGEDDRRWRTILSRPWQIAVRWRGFLWDFIRHRRSLIPIWVRRQAIDEWLERAE